MFIICAVDFNVLGPVVAVSVRILVVFACDQMGGSCNFRPSESISPRREMQGLVLSIGSPRRPSIGVERIVSRSGERRSPKRNREVT